MELIFKIVMVTLLVIAKLLHITYSTINVWIWICLIPCVWIYMLSNKKTALIVLTIGTLICSLVDTDKVFDFFANIIIKTSKFNNGTYEYNSVILCIVIPAFITILIHLKKSKNL